MKYFYIGNENKPQRAYFWVIKPTMELADVTAGVYAKAMGFENPTLNQSTNGTVYGDDIILHEVWLKADGGMVLMEDDRDRVAIRISESRDNLRKSFSLITVVNHIPADCYSSELFWRFTPDADDLKYSVEIDREKAIDWSEISDILPAVQGRWGVVGHQRAEVRKSGGASLHQFVFAFEHATDAMLFQLNQ